MDSISREFEEIAADFFSGRQVYDEKHYESKFGSEALPGHVSEAGVNNTGNEPYNNGAPFKLAGSTHFDQNPGSDKCYEIIEHGGDWSKVLNEVKRDGLLHDGPFYILLRDLTMNDELENSSRKHSLYHGFRVFSQTGNIKGAEKTLAEISNRESGEVTVFHIMEFADSKVTTTSNISASTTETSHVVDPASDIAAVAPSNDSDWPDKEPLPPKNTSKTKTKKKGRNSKKNDPKRTKSTNIGLGGEDPDLPSPTRTPKIANLDDKKQRSDTHTFGYVPESRSSVPTDSAQDFDEGGEWNVVQSKSSRKQSGNMVRPANTFNRARALVASTDSTGLGTSMPSYQPVSASSIKQNTSSKSPIRILAEILPSVIHL